MNIGAFVVITLLLSSVRHCCSHQLKAGTFVVQTLLVFLPKRWCLCCCAFVIVITLVSDAGIWCWCLYHRNNDSTFIFVVNVGTIIVVITLVLSPSSYCWYLHCFVVIDTGTFIKISGVTIISVTPETINSPLNLSIPSLRWKSWVRPR